MLDLAYVAACWIIAGYLGWWGASRHLPIFMLLVFFWLPALALLSIIYGILKGLSL